MDSEDPAIMKCIASISKDELFIKQTTQRDTVRVRLMQTMTTEQLELFSQYEYETNELRNCIKGVTLRKISEEVVKLGQLI